MNIKDYAKTKEKPNKKEKISKEDFNKTQEEYGDFAEQFVSRYGNFSQEELMQELFSLVSKKKEEGTFDAEKIKEASKHILPFLDNEQKEFMNNLLKHLD